MNKPQYFNEGDHYSRPHLNSSYIPGGSFPNFKFGQQLVGDVFGGEIIQINNFDLTYNLQEPSKQKSINRLCGFSFPNFALDLKKNSRMIGWSNWGGLLRFHGYYYHAPFRSEINPKGLIEDKNIITIDENSLLIDISVQFKTDEVELKVSFIPPNKSNQYPDSNEPFNTTNPISFDGLDPVEIKTTSKYPAGTEVDIDSSKKSVMPYFGGSLPSPQHMPMFLKETWVD
jgi:hypothetical protein